jgi:hypothetical protein
MWTVNLLLFEVVVGGPQYPFTTGLYPWLAGAAKAELQVCGLVGECRTHAKTPTASGIVTGTNLPGTFRFAWLASIPWKMYSQLWAQASRSSSLSEPQRVTA